MWGICGQRNCVQKAPLWWWWSENDNNNNDATCISILTMRVAEGIEARRLASVIDKVGGPRTLRFLIWLEMVMIMMMRRMVGMKIRTYFALPHKLQRSWICEGVVLKIWHRVQWLRYVTGEGRIYKMIITLCQRCRRIYGDDCTINVMKSAPQRCSRWV